MATIELLKNYVDAQESKEADYIIACIDKSEFSKKVGKNIVIAKGLISKLKTKTEEYRTEANEFYNQYESKDKKTFTWKTKKLTEEEIEEVHKVINLKIELSTLFDHKAKEVQKIHEFTLKRSAYVEQVDITKTESYKSKIGKQYLEIRDKFIEEIITNRASMTISKTNLKNYCTNHEMDTEEYKLDEYGINIQNNVRDNNRLREIDEFRELKKQIQKLVEQKKIKQLSNNQKEAIAISIITADLKPNPNKNYETNQKIKARN